ncbi:hypothetical protein MGYG_06713 [Nannizzia gypsea CBS 118893]|uniref:Uncharacterized protein n=1 Tax=Arthroderma gypseum (strain ATCC MYA-4604 / CBS 118893) TaxID=535722 RepID=E4V101_ARTGP|nr:hypothetical protein MGYG_06713 [Nannizzia gypsea CBS 118893]EFR03716.1 hypothetical protein MGYG_06713 [Nannizzia gypsea CBS 118893]
MCPEERMKSQNRVDTRGAVKYTPSAAQPPPFSVLLLRADGASPQPDEQLLSALPATYRTARDDLSAPSRDVMACVESELALDRLTRIFHWLWVAGRPMPPRPLHHQLLLGREIYITERMDMHLVWTGGRVLLKPVPRFLLEPRFWTEYLACRQGCECLYEASGVRECSRRRLWKSALGFLFSYAALITHESDFHIAKGSHLLPAEEALTWRGWRVLVEQLETEHIYRRINARFIYGELRLGRLNKIYYLSQRPFMRGYMSHWHQYRAFFQDNFTWLASATAYVAITLTAMQVGLATKSLAGSDTFQSASYGFTIFSILAPLAATCLIMFAFCLVFVDNFVVAVAYKKQRFDYIGVNSDTGDPVRSSCE